MRCVKCEAEYHVGEGVPPWSVLCEKCRPSRPTAAVKLGYVPSQGRLVTDATDLKPGDTLFIVADGWRRKRIDYEDEASYLRENAERKIELVECRFEKFGRHSKPGQVWIVARGLKGALISASGDEFHRTREAALQSRIARCEALIAEELGALRALRALLDRAGGER